MGRRILCTEIDSESEVHKQTHLKSMFTLCSRILRFPNSVQECNKSEIADCSRIFQAVTTTKKVALSGRIGRHK